MLSWRVHDYLSIFPLSLRIALGNRRKPRTVERMVRFGPHPGQYLLAFDPDPAASPRNNFVLFAHGGGWRMGNPTQFRFVGHFFAQRGYPTILAGYRLAPAHRFPAQMEDVFSALHWAVGSGWEGALGRRAIAVGHSAGAQLAALLVYHRSELARRGIDQSLFSGLVSVSGPLDFSACKSEEGHRLVADYLGDLERWELADPLHYLEGFERVHVLCLHGDRDPLVEVENSFSFSQRVNRSQEGLARVVVLRGRYHSDMLNIFLRDLRGSRVLEKWLVERE